LIRSNGTEACTVLTDFENNPGQAGIRYLIRYIMPELPDVEVFRHYAQEHAMNKKIGDVEYTDAAEVLESSKQKITRSLKGHKFTRTERTGKHMFLKTDEGRWLAMHFGMTGYLRYRKKGEKQPDYSKMIIRFEGGDKLSIVSKRKLGQIEITDDPQEYKKNNHIGMDALDCSFEDFRKALENKRGGIKNALMDQSRVSGIGNIYSDEILFQEKLHPKYKFEDLGTKELRSLHKTMQRVMKTAISNEAKPSELPRNYLLPHRKEGEDCPGCKGKVSKIKINGRGAYFCPDCQKL
jgi:formamidopyrimidine-DNA glycosylase